MTAWCRISTLELPQCGMKGQDTESLAEVLAQCPALTHLNLSFNGVGGHFANKFFEEENFYAKPSYVTPASHFARLAGVLPQCTALAHLDLSYNAIGPAGAGKLAAVLVKCPSLANINLS